ncbi:MAG TPA: DNA mismatch repair protein MutS [Desulfomonilia bacterium]
MMQQYHEIKKQHTDAILFYRMGDFYEMFYQDAIEASKILGIVLTTRDRAKENPVPMCGVPYHSASSYVAKLIKAGRKVAVCEQGEVGGKGLVKREVVQVLTPGLINEETHLDSRSSNYLMAVFQDDKNDSYGIAFTDITTGDFRVTELNSRNDFISEVCRISPSEILCQDASGVPQGFYTSIIDSVPSLSRCREILCSHFKTASLAGLGLEGNQAAAMAAVMVLNYVLEKQKSSAGNITSVRFYNPGLYMILGANTKKNLELFESFSKSKEDCLYNIINKTKTAMGARRLADWLNFPLMDEASINERLDALGELKNNPEKLSEIREALKNVYDLERILGRIVSDRATPRDLFSLAMGLEQVPLLKSLLNEFESRLIQNLELDPLEHIRSRIIETIVDDPPLKLGDSPVIRSGIDGELDELREIRRDSRKWIAEHEAQQRSITGITTLKIGYNRVFGYYIEVTRANAEKVPQSYIRKQTLVNAERYITPELKEYEVKLLNAQDLIAKIEARIFSELKEFAASHKDGLKKTINGITVLDAISSLAQAALENDYSRPLVERGRIIEIKAGRHPVVEKVLKAGEFVPNDCRFDHTADNIHIITGPNMAGKSTYMRQIALIVIMAQMGSFVPAKSATIGIADRIFTRIGASDNLSTGQSTFMVEMSETADILKNATGSSLVILDEIGRGTSTYDGMSLAWAVSEYLDRLGTRTFFATHYHELADLARKNKGIKNYHMAVEESGHDVVFVREVRRGATGRSYGIHVAKLAGIPEEVIADARAVLGSIDKKARTVGISSGSGAMTQTSIFDQPEPDNTENILVSDIIKQITAIDLSCTTPLEALNFLNQIKERINKS